VVDKELLVSLKSPREQRLQNIPVSRFRETGTFHG